MKSELIRGGKVLVLSTAAVGLVVAFVPGRAGLALRVYALVLAGAALVQMVGALRRSYPRATALRARSGRGRTPRSAPGTLVRLEQELALGAAGSFDLHHRLRPRVRELAAELLASRRGISLDGDPDRARAALGAETWDLVREDRPPPEDRLARGAPIPELVRVVESLERL